ncbi:MAG: hypothetical protein ABIF10_08475 [Candidatus Woesearchaeota archaeon]
MTSLVACLSTGQGTWNSVSQLIRQQQWDKVFLITNDFGKQKFSANAEFVVVDFNLPLQDISRAIFSQLQGKVSDLEVAVNILSGTGKEHMAILSALVKLGLGIRFVAAGEKGVEEY